MGKMHFVRVGALLSAFLCAGNAFGQITEVAGAPFTAMRIHTSSDGLTVHAKIARASNGSLYQEIPDMRPGHLPFVSILDIPNHRTIFLNGDARTYTVQPHASTATRVLDTSDAAIRERNERYRSLQTPRHDTDGEQESDIVPLGLRTVDGQTEFGLRRTYTRLKATSKLKQHVLEMWDRPSLALTVETDSYDDAGKLASSTKLTDILTEEPDAHLFEIPPDYKLATAHPIQ